MSDDAQRQLRSGKRVPIVNSDATPLSGETTTGSTNAWSKGTGNIERPNEGTSTQNLTPTAIDKNVENLDNSRRASPPATVVGRIAHTDNSRLTILLAELELRKAELVQAQAASAAARSKLEIARVEAAQSTSNASMQGERESRVEGWVTQQLNVRDRMEIRAREQTPGRNDDVGAQVNFENRDFALLSKNIEAAVSKSKNAPSMQRHVAELPHFDGNIKEWIAFKAEFLDTESFFSDVANVGRIRISLRGDARCAVKSILYTVTNPNEIMEMLEVQFGNSEAIVMAEISEIKRLPKLADDNHNITMFANEVANVVATIKTLRQDQYLLAPELVNRLVDKLNFMMRFEWNKYRAVNNNIPALVALSKFLTEISKSSNIPRRPITRSKHNVHAARQLSVSPPPLSRSSSRESVDTYEPRDTRKINRDQKPKPNPTVAQLKKAAQSKPKPNSTRPQQNSNVCYKTKCVICSGEHTVPKCADFLKLTVNERWDRAKEFKLCFRCLGHAHKRPHRCEYIPCGKGDCESAHHGLMHGFKRNQPARRDKVSSVNHLQQANVYLKIVPVELIGPLGTVETHALLDEGSTMTLLERHIADKIAPRAHSQTLSFQGVGGNEVVDHESNEINVSVRGACSRNFEKLHAYTIDRLNLGAQAVSRDLVGSCPYLDDISDELCYDNVSPTILIGQDNWHLIVSRQIHQGKNYQPACSLTSLGWVLHGLASAPPKRLVGLVNHVGRNDESEAFELIKQHFSIESLGVESKKPKADPDQRALEILNATCTKIPGESQYQAGLLWKSDDETLPPNKDQALKRLHTLERKLDKDANLKAEYSKHIDNLLTKGYAERIDSPLESPRGNYLAHFCVKHPQKGKSRLVFDAAAKKGNKSLNDALLSGPDLLQSLFGVLLRFREGRIGLSADIAEMYLRVKVIESDRDSLRFLWRGDNKEEPAQEYRMTSLIFGAASSPTTAIFCKNKNAIDHEREYPHVKEAAIKNFYVDDLLISFDDPKEAKRLVNDIYKVFLDASFELRGWASNDPSVISDVTDVSSSGVTELTKGECERTLGLLWNHKHDTLSFNVNFRNIPPDTLNGKIVPTKRQVTSGVMSLFDPMGLISPLTVVGRVLIQDVWRSGIGWDEPISHENNLAWCSFVNSMNLLNNLSLDRCVSAPSRKVDMHMFCDASEKIYAAAVYFVGTNPDGSKQSTLVAAKARVAPLKSISIPRLELQAAVLGTRLAESVKRESGFEIESSTYWSDSKTVLAWIKSDPRCFKSFVAHRLAEIEDSTSPCDWKWVPSAVNVADDATKGTPANFDKDHRWFHGPEFLKLDPVQWPKEKLISAPCPLSGEERILKPILATTRVETCAYLPDVSRFSSFTRLLRASASVMLAAEVFKAKLLKRHANNDVNSEHLELAELLLIKRSQRVSFKEEIELLEAGRPLPRRSSLHKVAVKMNEHGLLLLDGRIDRNHSTPVLHAKESLTKLIIAHTCGDHHTTRRHPPAAQGCAAL